MKEVVDNTDVFLPNSVSEMNRVANEFKLKNYNFQNVPNAIDKSVFTDETKNDDDNKFSEYKDCIICAARIEGRKSTLNLVRAVRNTNYKLVLVGKESQNQKEYVEQVHREAGKMSFFRSNSTWWLENLYKQAKVHALISWMETPGLSSLEAAVMDCNVVITPKGDTREYFEDYAFYCEPDDVASITKAIDMAFNAPVNPALKEKIVNNYIWEKTAKQTLKAYSSIITF